MKHKNWLVFGVLFALAGCGTASAQDTYTLNPVVVTAQREATEDLKTPAAVDVLTSDEIQKNGATSVQQALRFSTGVIMHAQGPRNISQGTMTDKAVIRGNEKGTLVLVDGVPINQGGRYNLEDIPTEAIDRIEIVRGGGAVLYGSEASGGVINIITKGTRDNSIKAGIGNYGIQNYAVSAQAGKFGITYSYDHTGKIPKISAPTKTGSSRNPRGMYYNIIRGEHNAVNWRYNFNDHLYFTHTYAQNSDHYRYKYNGIDYAPNRGKVLRDVLHSTKENLAILHYDNNDLKASLFYNRRDQKTENWDARRNRRNPSRFDPNTRTYTDSKYDDQSLGLDVSKRWHFDWGSFMVGYNFQRDWEYRVATSGAYHYSRNMHSVFGQVAYNVTPKDEADFNFRETWTERDSSGNKYDKFTPEVTWTHSFSDASSMYAKVGKSFMMPTFSQLYGGYNIIPSPGLKPETGTHYELGFKKNIGKSSWRFDVFHYKIKDHIDANTAEPMNIIYRNADIRNTGVELEWVRKQNENLSYHLGITYSHPEKRENDRNNGNWHDYYGRLEFNGGLNYRRGKLTTVFNLNVLAHRTRDSAPYESFKDQCFTDLDFSYQANKDARFFLNIDNLFNRHDIVSSAGSTFYDLGRNFLAGVEYKF